MEEVIETCYTPWIDDKCFARVKLSCQKNTTYWYEFLNPESRNIAPNFPSFLLEGVNTYMLFTRWEFHMRKKNCAWGLDCSQKGKGCTQDHSFFPRQTNLDWLIGYLFIVIVSSALLQMTQKIFHTLVYIVKSWTSYGCPISQSDSMM